MWMSDACAATPPSAVLPRSGLPEVHLIPHRHLQVLWHSRFCVASPSTSGVRSLLHHTDRIIRGRQGCVLRGCSSMPLSVAEAAVDGMPAVGGEGDCAAVQAPAMHRGSATPHAATSQ